MGVKVEYPTTTEAAPAPLVESGTDPALETALAAQQAAAASPSNVDIDRALAVLRQEESGNRNIQGPKVTYKSGRTDYPYGYYQIMGSNIPSWTKEVLGTSMSPREFLNDPDAQHKVAAAKFGGFVESHSLPDAYAIWASGRPLAQSSEDRDLVFKTKVGDTVAARMALYNGEQTFKPAARNKMPDIPNMLTPPAPTIGDTAQPSPFIQDQAPGTQDEFDQRYQEALGFLKDPGTKAAMLQMAIAAIQPRPVGQTVIGHLANAVGQGAEALGRQQATEEELRRSGVKEQQSQEQIDIHRQQVAQTGEAQKAQIELDKARIGQMSETNQLSWQRLALDRDRLEKDTARIDAAIANQQGQQRVNMLQHLGKSYQDLLKNAQDRLQLLSPDKNKAEYDATKAEIDRYQRRLGEVTDVYQKEIEKVAPGSFPAKPTGEQRSVIMSDEQFGLALRNNPSALTTYIQQGKIKPTEKQQALLDERLPDITDAQRVITPKPRPNPNPSVGQQIKGFAESIIPTIVSDPEVTDGWKARLNAASTGKEGFSPPKTLQDFAALKPEQKARVRGDLYDALPQKPPKDAPTWQAILSNPIWEAAARGKYTPEVVDRAKQDLAQPYEAERKTPKAKSTERMKSFLPD